jgi:hypothetical protein
VAFATGIAGLFGLAFIILFFTIGQPFGTLNDIFIAIAAILSGVLAGMLYGAHHAQAPLLSQFALIFALAGALVVVVGSVLVIFGFTGWFLAGLYMAFGNALIGLWLLGLSYSALHDSVWSHGLVGMGLVSGAIMALGLVALPGIFNGIDSQESASWIIKYVGQAGGVGWLILYPVWCILLGRMLQFK